MQTKQSTSIVVSLIYILRSFTKRNFICFETHLSGFKVLMNNCFPLQCVRQFRVILMRLQVSTSSVFASRRAAAWHIIRLGLWTFLESAHYWGTLVQEYSSWMLHTCHTYWHTVIAEIFVFMYHPSATVKSETVLRCSKSLPWYCVDDCAILAVRIIVLSFPWRCFWILTQIVLFHPEKGHMHFCFFSSNEPAVWNLFPIWCIVFSGQT